MNVCELDIGSKMVKRSRYVNIIYWFEKLRLLQWYGLIFPNPSLVRVEHRILCQCPAIADRERQWFSEPDLPLNVDHRSIARRMGRSPSSTSATKKHGFATSTITGTLEECLDKSLCFECPYQWSLKQCNCHWYRDSKSRREQLPLNASVHPRSIPVSVQKWSCISWCPMIPMIGGTSTCAHRAEALSNAGGLMLLQKLVEVCCL